MNPSCLLVWGHNPLISGPDGEIQFKVRECVAKRTKLIVVDPRFTEMARRADLWLQLRPGTDAALSLGTESLEEIYNHQLEPSGITFDELKKRGFVSVPMVFRKYEKSGFSTPSQKAELFSTILERLGYDPLPYHQEPPESPLSAPEIAEQYPLILTTGGRSQCFFHTEFRQIPSLRRRDPDPIVEIHPETAERVGIKDGDWVWIESPRGRITQKAKLTRGIDHRVVTVRHGWWFPEEPGPEYGLWKSNANVLTGNFPPYDPAMGTYQLRALLCKVYKSSSDS